MGGTHMSRFSSGEMSVWIISLSSVMHLLCNFVMHQSQLFHIIWGVVKKRKTTEMSCIRRVGPHMSRFSSVMHLLCNFVMHQSQLFHIIWGVVKKRKTTKMSCIRRECKRIQGLLWYERAVENNLPILCLVNVIFFG
jgi:hypothetical protein